MKFSILSPLEVLIARVKHDDPDPTPDLRGEGVTVRTNLRGVEEKRISVETGLQDLVNPY